MTFTFKVQYEDDSIYNYGEVRYKLVRAKNREQAMKRFKEKFGVEPIYACQQEIGGKQKCNEKGEIIERECNEKQTGAT